MSNNPGIIKKIIEWFKEEPPKEVVRFNNEEEVYEFIGKSDIHPEAKKLIERWFFINKRKEIIEEPNFSKQKLNTNRKYFDLFIDSLFVVENNKNINNFDLNILQKYVDDFKIFLNGFESEIFNVLSNRIKSANYYKRVIEIKNNEELK